MELRRPEISIPTSALSRENHREAFRRYIEGFRWVYKAGRLKIFSRSSYTSH
ncbi:hypothetical protein POPTR_006G100001v4 [Populus trichocarpa]|uniref:Uncharacterized protein n=1 Tax=Populus trichocarpa TaxID=3694 RepID=A0ACC0SU53_POPTR|nr:hypothetical protein POPTR_006G100001v4 [Populus trichocarpa]